MAAALNCRRAACLRGQAVHTLRLLLEVALGTWAAFATDILEPARVDRGATALLGILIEVCYFPGRPGGVVFLRSLTAA